jgi:putative sulfotransferase
MMERSIILSSGRCGSTLLSDLLAADPQILSAQEFFLGLPSPDLLGNAPMTGAEYWDLLGSPAPQVRALLRIGLRPKEFTYPLGGRWDASNLPRILVVTLSKLDTDPDALYDRLAGPVQAFPRQAPTAHHRQFLDTLAEMMGRVGWVERSGGSSLRASHLLSSYRDVKVIYLTRGWQDTAESMRRHPSFQLLQLRLDAISTFGVDPFALRTGQEVPAGLEPLLPDRLTGDLLRKHADDSRRSLHMCAFMDGMAEQAFADYPPRQLLRVTYESILADPVGRLAAIGDFLGLARPEYWAASVAHRVRRAAAGTAGLAGVPGTAS